jgi:hypothetical protein
LRITFLAITWLLWARKDFIAQGRRWFDTFWPVWISREKIHVNKYRQYCGTNAGVLYMEDTKGMGYDWSARSWFYKRIGVL